MADLYTDKWKLNDIEAVLFDKDGTFINSHIYWGEIIRRRIKAVMKHFGIGDKLFDSLCYSLGLDNHTGCLIPQGPIAILAREAVITSLINKLKEYGIKADPIVIEQIFKEVHEGFLPDIYDYVKIIDDSKVLFKKIKDAGVKLAVVTSDVHANTEAILKYLELDKYFDLIIGKDDCSKAKKTGEPALIALKKLGVNAGNTISVGDAQMDYLMARNASLKGSILVATGQTQFEELLDYTSTVVHNLKEVQVD